MLFFNDGSEEHEFCTPYWYDETKVYCGCVKIPKVGVDIIMLDRAEAYSDGRYYYWRCMHCHVPFCTYLEG